MTDEQYREFLGRARHAEQLRSRLEWFGRLTVKFRSAGNAPDIGKLMNDAGAHSSADRDAAVGWMTAGLEQGVQKLREEFSALKPWEGMEQAATEVAAR